MFRSFSDLPLTTNLTFKPRVNATVAKLNALPKRRYGNVTWPEGTPQPLTPKIAEHFFDLMSTSDCSLVELLRGHPELPPFRQLDSWRANNKNGFAERWRETRKSPVLISSSKSVSTCRRALTLKMLIRSESGSISCAG